MMVRNVSSIRTFRSIHAASKKPKTVLKAIETNPKIQMLSTEMSQRFVVHNRS